MVLSKKFEKIVSEGISLHDLGINNWALSREEALNVLDKFEYENLAVLGGDVYEVDGDEIELNYDNWYCEQVATESTEDFVIRSIKIARIYISGYRNNNQNQKLFVFVIG